MEVITKEKVNYYMEGMPEEFTIDELMDRISLLAKLERGMQQINNGEVVPNEKIVEKFRKWQRER